MSELSASAKNKAFDTAMGPAKEIDERYKNKGMSIYTFLIIVFIGFSIGFIVYKYSQRSNPAITVDYKEESWSPPDIYMYPENLWQYRSGYCDISPFGDSDELPDGYGCDNYLDEDGWNILSFPGVTVYDTPGMVTFETYYFGNTSGFQEAYLYLDGSKASIFYIGASPWYSLSSRDNNLIMTMTKYEHLDSSKDRVEYALGISTNILAYDDSSYWHTLYEDVYCPEGWCDSSDMTECVGDYDEVCGFSSLIYIQLQTRTVQYIKEVDPVKWGEILGTLGGYWVYVGAFFGLLFAKNPDLGDQKLHPSKIARKLLCIKD